MRVLHLHTAALAWLVAAACSPPEVTAPPETEPHEVARVNQPSIQAQTGIEIHEPSSPGESPGESSPAEAAQPEPIDWGMIDPEALPELGSQWVHPLAGDRELPDFQGREFGAFREGDRPDECGDGHCGVDLGHLRGAIVHAVAPGVIRTTRWHPTGRAGRYVSIDHESGMRTYYMHLDRIREDLEAGRRVEAGEPIGTVGSTGVLYDGPHLHFAAAQRLGDDYWFFDPEPMLRRAIAHDGPASLAVYAADMVAEDGTIVGAEPAIPEPGPTGGIGIEVRDAHTRTPVAAMATAVGPDDRRVTAPISDGYVELRGLAPGRWTVTVRGAGYVVARATYDVPAGDRAVTVRDQRIELSRGAVLAGIVRDANGDRVPGARVTLGDTTAVTDADGQFRLRNAPTGRVTLRATHGDADGAEDLHLGPGDELVTLLLVVE